MTDNELMLKVSNMIERRMKFAETRLERVERYYWEMKLELMDLRKEIRLNERIRSLSETVEEQGEILQKLKELKEAQKTS